MSQSKYRKANVHIGRTGSIEQRLFDAIIINDNSGSNKLLKQLLLEEFRRKGFYVNGMWDMKKCETYIKKAKAKNRRKKR